MNTAICFLWSSWLVNWKVIFFLWLVDDDDEEAWIKEIFSQRNITAQSHRLLAILHYIEHPMIAVFISMKPFYWNFIVLSSVDQLFEFNGVINEENYGSDAWLSHRPRGGLNVIEIGIFERQKFKFYVFFHFASHKVVELLSWDER